jgi:hypothetical protein
MCSAALDCEPASCARGFANCDGNSNDCETDLAAAGDCGLEYVSQVDAPSENFQPLLLDDGSYFVIGAFQGPTDFDPGPLERVDEPSGEWGSFVSKFAADGKYGWTYTDGQSYLRAAPTRDGGLLLGRVIQSGAQDQAPPPQITRLNADGTVRWERSLDNDPTVAGGVPFPFATSEADLIIYTFGTTTELSSTAWRFEAGQTAVLKLDGDGTLVSATPLGDKGCGITISAVAAGSLLMSGTVKAGCTLAGVRAVQDSSFVAALSADGAVERVQWLFGGTVVSVLGFPDGSAAVGGTFQQQIGWGRPDNVVLRDSGNPKGVGDGEPGFVLKLSAELEPSWAKVLPMVMSITQAPDGGVVASVDGQIPRPDSTPDNMAPETWLVQIRRDGSPGWTAPIGLWSVADLSSSGSTLLVGGNPLGGDLDAGPDVAEATRRSLARYRM